MISALGAYTIHSVQLHYGFVFGKQNKCLCFHMWNCLFECLSVPPNIQYYNCRMWIYFVSCVWLLSIFNEKSSGAMHPEIFRCILTNPGPNYDIIGSCSKHAYSFKIQFLSHLLGERIQ